MTALVSRVNETCKSHKFPLGDSLPSNGHVFAQPGKFKRVYAMQGVPL